MDKNYISGWETEVLHMFVAQELRVILYKTNSPYSGPP